MAIIPSVINIGRTIVEKNKTLIVIVPAYNEKETIGETLASLRKITVPLAEIGFDLKLYVVNDGSKDATQKAAQNAKADRVIVHKVNRGLGAAVRSGLTAARHDGAGIAIKFDADLQHEPDDILKLIEPILNDESDVVYGYRFSNIKYRMPLVRKVGNKGLHRSDALADRLGYSRRTARNFCRAFDLSRCVSPTRRL